MANEIYGFKVDGVTYEYDYGHLANNPIPEAGSNDSGKVLTAGPLGSIVWTQISGLPQSTSSDEGKVLTVCNNGMPVWDDLPSGGGLPDSSSSDEGKTLVVQSNGAAVWAELIPAFDCGDHGKVLKAGGCGTQYFWDDVIDTSNASSGDALIYIEGSGFGWQSMPAIPECYDSDEGKVLMVGDNGALVWASL